MICECAVIAKQNRKVHIVCKQEVEYVISNQILQLTFFHEMHHNFFLMKYDSLLYSSVFNCWLKLPTNQSLCIKVDNMSIWISNISSNTHNVHGIILLFL